jgi:DNA-binding MarR family transcriptional regulator
LTKYLGGHIFALGNYCLYLYLLFINICQKEPVAMIDLCSVRKLQNAIKELETTLKKDTGLSLNDAMCLCSISRGIREPGLLARELDLSPSRLSRILDSLETRNLVTRSLSDKDRRSISVQLTSYGDALIIQYRCAQEAVPDILSFEALSKLGKF